MKHYMERHRPQYHFSMKKGWINDPNGLVYFDGTYHLFCQHNPDAVKWGPMRWSHATSPDMVNWTEQPIALFPDDSGTMYSGSAVVDWENTSGLGSGGNPPLLAFYTAAGKPFTQGLAFSNDKGHTWKKYDGNPVLGHVEGSNRDPKVFWHVQSKRWIMVLYLDKHSFAIFGSDNTLKWEELSRFDIPGSNECPDLFEMPVEGGGGESKWVFLAGAGSFSRGECARYVVGYFDGRAFSPESESIAIEWGAWNYSTQTYSDAPDGRRIFVSWFSTAFNGSAAFPGNPFNGQYRVPWELRLLRTEDGLRLARLPVKELNSLRGTAVKLSGVSYTSGIHEIGGVRGRSMDIECVITPNGARSVEFQFEGVEAVSYEFGTQTLRVLDRVHQWPLEDDGTLKLRVLFDVNCIEVFGPQGLKVMSSIYLPETLEHQYESERPLSLEVEGGPLKVESMAVYPVSSIWRTE